MTDIKHLVEGLANSDDKYAYECLKQLEKESLDSHKVYVFFDTFKEMLDSKSSYIRSRGILLIAANAKWDVQNRIDEIIHKYLEHITDPKPITARQCIKALPSIIRYKPALKHFVLEALENADLSIYNDNMGPLVLKDIQKSLKDISKV